MTTNANDPTAAAAPAAGADDQTTSNETIASDLGLSAEEQAQFDAMRDADPAPVDPGAPTTPEPAPAAPVAPAAAAASDDDDDDGPEHAAPVPGADPNAKPQPRRVSFNKFAREESARKKLESDLAEERKKTSSFEEKTARLDERLKLINEALTPKPEQEAEDVEPDPDTDVFAWSQWQRRENKRLKAQIDQLATPLTELTEGKQAQDADAQLADTYLTDASAFAAKNPDFVPAYQHLMTSRLAQLAAYYYDVDIYDQNATLNAEQVQKIRQIAAREEREMVAGALKAKKSPAEAVFKMARAYGFRPGNGAAAPAPSAAPAAAAPSGGPPPMGQPTRVAPASAVATNGAAAPAVPSVVDEVNRIKAGQEAALSLSNGGGTPTSPLTAERLANMPEHEFNAMLERLDPAELQAIMGGSAN